jgi:hypothetical protein
MFCVKGFAAGRDAGRFFGFAAPAIEASATAASIAATKHAVHNVEPLTFVTARVQRVGLTNGTGREPIDNGWLQFALWIKLPLIHLPPAISWRRCFFRRQLHLSMSLECLTASFAASPADSWILFNDGGDCS